MRRGAPGRKAGTWEALQESYRKESGFWELLGRAKGMEAGSEKGGPHLLLPSPGAFCSCREKLDPVPRPAQDATLV
jgi:hypothetical protein